MQLSRTLLMSLLLGGAVTASGVALSQPDMRARAHVGPIGRPHAVVHVDRFHRVPPDIRVRSFPGHVAVRVTPFRAHLGWRVNRFTPHERALWTHGRWWHGRHHGRFGWWWWADGGWFFYDTPIYPYPDYVSESYYAEPSESYGDYWYYCRDPEGYYPYVRQCHGAWEPVPAQPGYDVGSSDQDQMGSDDYGPDNYGLPDQGDSGDYGPPDGPEDQGPPDEGQPPPR